VGTQGRHAASTSVNVPSELTSYHYWLSYLSDRDSVGPPKGKQTE
jgi:hypothetical protein